MKKFFLALFASALMASTAQAVPIEFDGNASFDPKINSVNPGLQAKAVVLKNSGPQDFVSFALKFDLENVGDTFSTNMFVVRTLSSNAAGDDYSPKGFGLMFAFGQGNATVTGTTYAKNKLRSTFGVMDFDGPVKIALGNAQALLIRLADATFNKGPEGLFTPGKANGAVVSATFELAAVPLPATLPLALGAFGALAFVARRRKGATQV